MAARPEKCISEIFQVIDLIEFFTDSILQKEEVYNKPKYSKVQHHRVFHKVIHSKSDRYLCTHPCGDTPLKSISHRS